MFLITLHSQQKHHLVFFCDRAWARFSLRREEKCYKRVGYRTTTDCRKTHKDDYTTPIERPGSLPNLQSTDSRHLNPAWNQSVISSYTLVSTSSTVRTRRSKVLSFLSFQSIQEVRITRLSKQRRLALDNCFLAVDHQETKKVDWAFGAKDSQSDLRSKRNQTSLVNGQAISRWSTVSDICAHNAQESSSCNPCFFLRAAVQQRSWITNQMKNLHFPRSRQQLADNNQ